MGIRGLTKYVGTLEKEKSAIGEGKVWESFDLQDTNLVIDGCGLYYHIYASCRLNFKYGGEYNELQKKIEEFFAKLRSNNVVPYVVFDGIMARDEKKLDTRIKRNRERIEQMPKLSSKEHNGRNIVLPRLAQLAVVQVLQEINRREIKKIYYAVADFEADCEIASLANKLHAPVMAKDSDFYIFDIKHGYIPFQQYNISGSNTTVKKFSFNGFAKHLGIVYPSMLPLLASLAGNDYISDEELEPFDAHIKLVNIAQFFLSKYNSVSEGIHAVIGLYSNDRKSAFEKVLLQSIEEYQMKQSNLIGYFYSGDLLGIDLGIDPSMLPLLASLAGNDYISDEELEPFAAHIEKLVSSSKLDASGNQFVNIAQFFLSKLDAGGNQFVNIAQFFLSKYNSVSEAIHAVTGLYSNDRKSAFEKVLLQSIEEYQMKQSNLIGYFDSGDLSCNMRTYKNNHSLPQWVVKLYREGLIASEGLNCLCNRKIFLRTQCEDISLPSAQTCAQDLRWFYYYALALNCKDTVVVPSVTELTSQRKDSIPSLVLHGQIELGADFNHMTATMKDIIEFVRKESKLTGEFLDLTGEVLEIKIEIHDRPQMSDQEKKSHLLNLLHSDLPFIHGLPIKHQLVVSALRYWVIHAQVKPTQTHLAAWLVQYVGEKPSSSGYSESSPPELSRREPSLFLEAVHGFSQLQNVLYWVERLNVLFSYTFLQLQPAELSNTLFPQFPQLQVAELYNGTQACLVYKRLQDEGYKFAESIVTNANLYRHLYDVTTGNLPRDCQFKQSRSSQRQQAKRKTAR